MSHIPPALIIQQLIQLDNMKTSTVLAFSALALAAPTPETEVGTKVPLLRRKADHQLTSGGSVHFEWFKDHLRYTLLKYNKDFELPDFLQDLGHIGRRDTNANEPLTDQNDGGDDELQVHSHSADQRFHG